jgi:hypothetical protein
VLRRARFPTARSLAAGAAVGAAAALAAGCGAASPAPARVHAHAHGPAPLTPRQAVDLAATHAGQLRTVTATFTQRGSGAIRQTGAGTITEQLRPTLRADLAEPVETTDSLVVPGGDEMILSGSTVYYRSPSLTAILGTRPWLKVPGGDVGKLISGTVVRDSIDLTEDDGPVIQGELLAAAQNVRQAGATRLHGIPVTEYAGSYQLRAAVNVLPAAAAAVVRQAQVKPNFDPVTFTVWLDRGEQIRKLVATEKALAPSAYDHVAIETRTITIVVTSINRPVIVTIPPAAQVSRIPPPALGSRSYVK